MHKMAMYDEGSRSVLRALGLEKIAVSEHWLATKSRAGATQRLARYGEQGVDAVSAAYQKHVRQAQQPGQPLAAVRKRWAVAAPLHDVMRKAIGR